MQIRHFNICQCGRVKDTYEAIWIICKYFGEKYTFSYFQLGLKHRLGTDVHVYRKEMSNGRYFPPWGPLGICWVGIALQPLEDTDTGYTCGCACKVVAPSNINCQKAENGPAIMSDCGGNLWGGCCGGGRHPALAQLTLLSHWIEVFFGWVNSVSRLHREAQSDVMAGCNECFPVGRTVTLWMAGAWKPEGEREGMRLRMPSWSRGCSQLI